MSKYKKKHPSNFQSTMYMYIILYIIFIYSYLYAVMVKFCFLHSLCLIFVIIIIIREIISLFEKSSSISLLQLDFVWIFLILSFDENKNNFFLNYMLKLTYGLIHFYITCPPLKVVFNIDFHFTTSSFNLFLSFLSERAIPLSTNRPCFCVDILCTFQN